MTTKNNTAYCGIYCPDCLHLHNQYSTLARQLEEHLVALGFDKYASIESPFGQGFRHWQEFADVLHTLATTQCERPCRSGGGCSGKPCAIMECCLDKGFEGCWECDGLDDCDKFDFLSPRCGSMPKDNLREIQQHGLDGWESRRHPFYVWQK
ncbi:DUF3795 domain-containing protein [Desulfovibrio inopinatus]|uniref:DUF3795 domain-containing protein n=1 Tax=Desulfovibrio inopinatus TaxID=102109 RepID=UPI0012EC39B9|nr:DUF3795 domain-containing protein [Desulfovibrio inopinatus]